MGAAERVRPEFGRRLDLSTHEVHALEHLASRPMGPVALSRLLGITSAASTVMVRRLEDAGHLRREPDPADRRRTTLHVTAAGMARLLRHVRPMVEGLDAVDAALDPAERLIIARYLDRVTEVFAQTVSVDPEVADGPPPSGVG